MTSPPPLPIGIQSFADLRRGGYVYVDKTPHALALAGPPKGVYFLSRPRRFGKSLFLDTLDQLFRCRRELFTGLYIEDKWDWDHPYPVIRISFGGGAMGSETLLAGKIEEQLRNAGRDLGVECGYGFDDPRCFADLIRRACEQYQRQVVILVDEYDKPILDRIEAPETALQLRDMLRDFYSVIKDADPYIRFVFLTGVSKFSRVSIFSGLNNLNDITLDERYATICGYTHTDVQECFSAYLPGVDEEELQRWYNGYRWLGEPVYNPIDVLLFFDKGKRFRHYWFETGSPSFLVKLFQRHRYFLPDLEDYPASEEILSSFDVGNLEPVTLLWQTGYLTIREVETRLHRLSFRLGFPNLEVRQAFNDHLLAGYSGLGGRRSAIQDEVLDALTCGEVERLAAVIHRLFAAIPYRNFSAMDLADYEGYYASVLYACFASLGLAVIPEDVTNHGQADMTVRAPGHTWVMEIKVVASGPVAGNPALEQLLARGYADKYRGEAGTTVHCLGLVFGRKERNLVAWDAA